MAIDLAAVRDELRPGLFKVQGEYPRIPAAHKEIFQTRKSNLNTEIATQMAYLGAAQYKADGGATVADNRAGQRYKYSITHVGVGLMYAITRNAIVDNLYKDEFRPMNLGLMNSHMQTKETIAANILNNAQTQDTTLGGDGVALCSASHPIDGGNTWSNTFAVQQSLNESSLANAQIQIRTGFVDERNLKIMARARKLVVPPQLEPVALRLLHAELRPGTNENDPNILTDLAGGTLSKTPVVWDYLTSSYSWFLKTSIDGLIHFEREAFETDLQTDFVTDNLLVKSYERYSFNYTDPRCIFGSFPSS